MANVKITALTAAAALTADDLLAIVDDPSGTPVTKRATLQQILDLITAADVGNTPSGNLTATDVQAALDELQTDVDARRPVTEAIFLSASEFNTLNGSPAQAQRFGFVTWNLDAATDESVVGSVLVPSGVTTAGIYLWWTNPGAGTGDVVWRVDWNVKGDGEDLSTGLSFPTVTATAPSQDVVEVTTIATGLTVTPGDLMALKPYRDADNASDTLANDAAFMGIELRWS